MTTPRPPRIIFFKEEKNPITSEVLEKALFDFINSNLGTFEHSISYSSTRYSPPEKDNQFIETYSRDVRHHFKLDTKEELIIQFISESSDDATFKKKWLCSFYSFSIAIKTDWTNFKKIWQLFKPFLQKNGFQDATLQYTFSNQGVYDFFSQQDGLEAKNEIIQLTTEEILASFANKEKTNIEVQNKPYLNISYILSQHPHKLSIDAIQINANGLKTFPKELLDFSNLRYLYIYNNEIKEATEGLKALKQLIHLNIHSNPIKNKEAEMIRLKQLLPTGCTIA